MEVTELMKRFDIKKLHPMARVQFEKACTQAIRDNDTEDAIIKACAIYYNMLKDNPEMTV